MRLKLFLSLTILVFLPWRFSLAQEVLAVPLAQLMMRPDSIRLNHLADEYRLSFPVPDRYRIEQARLVLDFVHSNALVPSRSQLRVQVNGVTVAQWRLHPERPHRQVAVEIPHELLLHGYNHLQFLIAQHYTDSQCEAPTSPELWTEINSLRSRLEFEYTLRPLPLSLARLTSLFDKKWPNQAIAVLVADAELGEETLNWGGLVTQGIALRKEYAPFRLEIGNLEAGSGDGALNIAASPGRDLVIMAERSALTPFFSPDVTERIKGPYLGIFPVPGNPERFALLISGKNAAEVRKASRVFAWMNAPLPDASETVVKSIRQDPESPYQGYPALEPQRTYRFRDLGFTTSSRQGIQPIPIEFELFLPPDLFAPEHAEVVFRLHLAYNAGMRNDSLMEVSINGVFEQAIRFSEENGAHYRDYRLAVPVRTLRPGLNRISFQPRLMPLVTGECQYFQTGNLQVTLFDDSEIQMPPAEHYTQLPDLSLLAASGFPYLGRDNGEDLGVWLLNRRQDTVLSAWQLVARLARLNKLPLDGAKLSYDPFPKAKDLIVVGGGMTSLEHKMFRHAPMGTGPWRTWRYLAGKHPESPRLPWWKALLGRFLAEDASGATVLDDRYVTVEQSGGLGGQALGLSFRNPDHPSRLVTLFLAEGDLYPAIRALTHPGLWSQMRGDLIFWNQDSKTLFWQRISEPFYVGKAGIKTMLLFQFSRHPWYWLLAVLAVIVLFALLTHFLLSRFKRRHHPDAKEIVP